jgi:uncharacterized protein YfaS (alpha-2-macroglobulin family)
VLTYRALKQLGIADPELKGRLPGPVQQGLEKLYAQQHETNQPEWGAFAWWRWQWCSRTEMRDDEVVLSADYLPQGTCEYTYAFRATLPGEYRAIPAVANEMYFPEVFGQSDGRLLTITGGE